MKREFKARTPDEMQKEIERLESLIEAYKKSGMEMGREITTLKHQLAGSKGRNKQVSQQIVELRNLVEHYRQLDLEGDELNEKRIAEIEEKNKVIAGLNSQVTDLSAKLNRAWVTLKERHEEISALKEQVTDLKRPWWQKLFC